MAERRRLPRRRRPVQLVAVARSWHLCIFSDVDDNRFYAGPIEWAFNNGITTGSPAGSDTFKPDDPVTRGESVTFLNRYHNNIVRPARDAAVTTALLGTATIPSGTTVTGTHAWVDQIVVDNAVVRFEIDLPGRATQDFTSTTVNFAPDPLASDADSTCTGTYDAPTAPPGKVCIYLGNSLGIDSVVGFAADAPVGFQNRSFRLNSRTDGAFGDDALLVVTWAYTAP